MSLGSAIGSAISRAQGSAIGAPRVGGEAPPLTPMVATGGTIEDFDYDGFQWRRHTFAESGDFVVTDPGTFTQGFIEALTIGGGGAGGVDAVGGGGGGASATPGTYTAGATGGGNGAFGVVPASPAIPGSGSGGGGSLGGDPAGDGGSGRVVIAYILNSL